MKTILSCLAFIVFTQTAFSQDIHGYWQGVLYQPNGPWTTYFPYSLQLEQPDTTAYGTSRIEYPNQTYYNAVHNLQGIVSNNVFTFSHRSVVYQNPPPGGYWCMYTATLTYDSILQKMTGPWSGSGCSPGTVEVWRIKFLSDTIFCKGQSIHLSVTGQQIRWYTDQALTNLVDTGNIYSPVINTTTVYYVTQSHYGVQSPAAIARITLIDTTKPTIYITANPSGAVIPVTPVIFTATTVNGGTSPTYTWKKNGQPVGNNSDTYTDSALATGTLINCQLTSSAPCATPATVMSDAVSVVLPLQLIKFSAIYSGNKVYCNWHTASEKNIAYYNIEKSRNGHAFAILKQVEVKSYDLPGYTFTDDNPYAGKSYYRLRIVSKNGSYTYSQIASVSASQKHLIILSPNPVAEKLNIRLESAVKSKVDIHIKDMSGKILFHTTFDAVTGSNFISVPVQSLARGIYAVSVLQNNDRYADNFIKW